MKFFRNYKILTLIILQLSSNIFSTNYYIDSVNGKDSNTGKSALNPWQSISKINKSVFFPGDSILFKSGCEWRDEFVVPSSGLINNPIVISSYSKGNKPIIKGSQIADKWNKYKDNIWMCNFNIKPTCIWFVNKHNKIIWGNEKTSESLLNVNYDYYWKNGELYIFFYSDKVEKIPIVECSTRDFGIISGWYGTGKNYIIIENLEILFTKNANVRAVSAQGWTVQNCLLHHSGNKNEIDGQGIQYEGQDGVFRNNIIYENGQHGFFLSSFGNADIYNNVISKNKIYNNYHTSIDLMNDGGSENSHRKTIIKQNLIYDEKDFTGLEVGIQTLGYGKGMVKNVKIHHNIISNINGAGISVVPNSDSIYIHNNTVYETKSSCISVDNNNYYTEVINNIGINNNYYAVFFLHDSTSKKINYNLWYTEKESETKIAFVENAYFNNHNIYSEKTRFDKNGFSLNPSLIVKQNIPIGINKYSICQSNGKKLNYKYDFYNRPIKNNINIGAIQ